MKLYVLFFSILLATSAVFLSCENGDSASVSPQVGVGGSMARFAITDNTLYIVSKETLEAYNIEDGGNPVKRQTKDIGVGIETIFPYNDKLFIGANDGMYIYNNQSPGNPQFITKYTHIQSCDPVVVQGDYAYVTLRGTSVCRTGLGGSSLDVVDISEPEFPQMVHTQAMSSPYGLGVSGNKLFVCDGDQGMRVMDISNPAAPNQIRHYTNIPSYDVIARNNNLIVTGKQGLYQFRYDETEDMEFLSKIPVQ